MNNLQEVAERCMLCKKPRCKQRCPISTPIPDIIKLFKEQQIEEAGKVLFDNNPLSAICAIVCPHEKQCAGNCVKGLKGDPVEFYKIEKYISTNYMDSVQFKQKKPYKDRVAIVGSGPSGLTVAFILASKGYRLTIFEAQEKIGGVLRYGIPEFRLPKEILDKVQEKLVQLGVKIRPNTLVGPVLTIDKLFFDGYKAIFLGTGVWNPKTLDIKGETLGHVHYAIDYLKDPTVYELGKKVCVIGAGNVAMDVARTAKRRGAELVTVLSRESFADMPAAQAELNSAKQEGIIFETNRAPLEILDEGVVCVETRKTADPEGNSRYVSLNNTKHYYECDSVIIAISQAPRNNIVANTRGIETTPEGLVITDEFGNTTRPGVFASGDVVTGSGTVSQAVNSAKIVAEAIDQYCTLHRSKDLDIA